MPNDAMMEQMMSQMQGEAPPMPPPTEMPPPEMMMEQTEEVAMPEGGIASFVGAEEAPMVPESGIGSLTEMTSQLAAMGREGDIYVVHASEGDTVIPMDVLNANPQLKDMLFAQIGEMGYKPERYIVGNELNSINPETGLPEFFFKKMFKKLKTVAKIALPIALAYFGPAALVASGLTGATTVAQLGPVLTGLAAGAGGAAGTALTGGNLEESLISGGVSGLTAGLDAKFSSGALSADRLPFQTAGGGLPNVGQNIIVDPNAVFTEGGIQKLASDQQLLARQTAAGLVPPVDIRLVSPQTGIKAATQKGAQAGLQAITNPTMFQRAGAFLNPIRDATGQKLVYNAATKTLAPVTMGAIKAAFPAVATTVAGSALMGGEGGGGDAPQDVYGDPTPEQIAALRLNFQEYPTTRRPYNALVRPGRAYARDGGLASLLPVRKMQTGGGIFDIDPALSPSGQLDRLNELYAQEYRKATTGPNPITESQFVSSPLFGDFENRLISTIGSLPYQTANESRLKADLAAQESRASDPSNLYNTSASRIAEAMRNQLGAFNTQQNTQNAEAAAQQAAAQQAGIFSSQSEFSIDPDTQEIIDNYNNINNPPPPPPPPLPPVTPGDILTAPQGIETEGYPYYSPFYKEDPAIEDEMVRRQQAQQLASERLASARANLPRVADPVSSFRQGIEEGAAQKMEMGGKVYGPRRTGEVPGPLGIERDIVPADLMPGEFVFTKDAVEGVGKLAGGGYKDGIKTMYGLMKRFEGVA